MFNGKGTKKLLTKILLCLFFVLVVIILPFVIEKIILSEAIFPFNVSVTFPKDVWFGFMGSYLGAIGTIVLGYIAFYQNKKYKELSDQSEKRFWELQEEIKELTKKSVSLIDLNSKIEASKYHPIFSNLQHNFWNAKGENLVEFFDIESDAFQISFCKEGSNEHLDSLEEIFEQYYTFVYTLKNDGEKTIYNFNCIDIKINGRNIEEGIWIYQSCDIKPGEIVRCVCATKFDLLKKISSGEIQEYFAALYTVQLDDEQQKKFLKLWLQDDDYRTTSFYLDMLYELETSRFVKNVIIPGIRELQELFEKNGKREEWLITYLYNDVCIREEPNGEKKCMLSVKDSYYHDMIWRACNIGGMYKNVQEERKQRAIVSKDKLVEIIEEEFGLNRLVKFEEIMQKGYAKEVVQYLYWARERYEFAVNYIDSISVKYLTDEKDFASMLEEL